MHITPESGIYIIENIVNGKVYVGSSIDLRARVYNHWWHLRKGSHRNSHLQRSWDHYGASGFVFEVVEYVNDCGTARELLTERENWWIDLLDSRNRHKGYNLSAADQSVMSEETKAKLAEAQRGRRHTPEAKAKMALAKLGTPSPRKGMPHSPETRKKLSEANTGKPSPRKGVTLSAETREKIAAKLRGRPTGRKGIKMSAAARAKMSEAAKARYSRKRQLTLEDNISILQVEDILISGQGDYNGFIDNLDGLPTRRKPNSFDRCAEHSHSEENACSIQLGEDTDPLRKRSEKSARASTEGEGS